MFQEPASEIVPSIAAASLTAFSPAATSVPLLFADVLSATATSSMAFFTAAASLASFSAAVVASLTALDVPGATTRDVAASELGCGEARAAGACFPIGGGPPIGRSPLWSNLLLYGGWSSSHNTSSSLWTGIAALPFHLLEPGPVLGAPGPLATSIPGICTP
jgi:hypothetical protein